MNLRLLLIALVVAGLLAAGLAAPSPMATGAFGPSAAMTPGSYLPLTLRDGLGTAVPPTERPSASATSTSAPGTHTATPTLTPTASATPTVSPSPTREPGPAPTTTVLFEWTPIEPVDMARSEPQGIAVGGKLYVLGGFYTERLETTDKAEVYDPASRTWSPIADMPIPLTHAPMTTDGRYVYVVGGFIGDHPGPSITQAWRYDTVDEDWRALPSLPEPMGGSGVALLGRNLHVFGGTNRTANGTYNDTSAHYVLNLDGGTQWQSLAPLPNPRNHMAGAVVDGKIYALGGQKRGNEDSQNQAQVDVYDPTTNTWSRAADMPVPRGHITSSTIVDRGRIITIGGSVNGGNYGISSSDVFLYDPPSNTWIKLPSLPSGRKTPVADIIDGRLYSATGNKRDIVWSTPFEGAWERGPALPAGLGEVAGGIIGNKLYLVGEGSNATFAYDLSTATWSNALAPRPYAGHHHAAEVYGGKLYLFGGLGSGSAGKVQIYDPVANAWSLGADMPFGAGSSASALIGGQVYVAGGITGSSTTSEAARYNPALNVWSVLPPMPQGRNHAAAATDGSRLFVFGGRGPGSGDGNSVANGFNTLQIFDPATNTWTSSDNPGSALAPLPQARGGMGKAVFHAGEFYVLGGETENGAGANSKRVYARVDIYDPAANTWRYGVPMPTARHGIFPLLHAGRVYTAGGGAQAGNAQSTVMEVYNPPR